MSQYKFNTQHVTYTQAYMHNDTTTQSHIHWVLWAYRLTVQTSSIPSPVRRIDGVGRQKKNPKKKNPKKKIKIIIIKKIPPSGDKNINKQGLKSRKKE